MQRAKFLSILLLTAGLAVAQTPVTLLTGNNIGYAGTNGKNVVRDSLGALYAAYMDEAVVGTRTIKIAASYDLGVTWGEIILGGINDATNGESGATLVNNLALAIDDQDRLHLEWHRSGGGLYQHYYCNIDPYTLVISPVVDLKAMLGVPSSTSSDACGIAVDPTGTVWCIAGTSSSWRAQLLKSSAPYASTGAFTSVGNISASASAQFARLAIDAFGQIHCVYYENTGTGDYRHRMYDPVAGVWSVGTNLGNLTPTNDYTGGVACDNFGNVHMISNRDAFGTGNPSIVYYMRDMTGTFTGPITVSAATNAQWTGNNQHTVDLACNEATGDVYAAYRDFSNGGELTVQVLPAGGSAFVPLATLAPANAGQHYYYAPSIRGTLFPAGNNTGTDVHVTWREMWPAPYDYKFISLGGGSLPTAAYPGNGTDAKTAISVNGLPSVPPTNVRTVSGGDIIGMTFSSPMGTLNGFPFIALGEIITTGAPPAPIQFPGDALPTVFVDLSLPIVVIADGLSNPGGLFAPILVNYSVAGAVPPFLSGTGKSVLVVLLVADPGRNAVNLGNAEAQELVIL